MNNQDHDRNDDNEQVGDVYEVDVQFVTVDEEGNETAVDVSEVDSLVAIMSAAWPEGKQVPHLTYEDPPTGMTPAQYQDKLAAIARQAQDLQEFTMLLVRDLGRDLFVSHHVPPDMIVPAVKDFAAKVYAEAVPSA